MTVTRDSSRDLRLLSETTSLSLLHELTIGLIELLSDFISNDTLFSVLFEGLEDGLSSSRSCK